MIFIAALTLAKAKRAWPSACPCLIPKKEVSAEEVERVVKKILGNLKFKLGIEIR